MTLTPQQQDKLNSAIAERCGIPKFATKWKFSYGDKLHRTESRGYSSKSDADSELRRVELEMLNPCCTPPVSYEEGLLPPNYCSSLDAVHEAEKALTDEQHALFRKLLFTDHYNRGEGSTNDSAERARVSATAEQRCLALAKVWGIEV